MTMLGIRGDKFWQCVDLAQRNPRLWATWENWNRFLCDESFYRLEPGLRNYFGCSEEQIKAWIAWSTSRAVGDQRAETELLKEAMRLTWETDSMPGRFVWCMETGWIEP